MNNQQVQDLPKGNKVDRVDDQFATFQQHIGVGKKGNTTLDEGGLYQNKFSGMANETADKPELMLVNEEEAPEKLPPNMPNFDPF